MEHSGGRRVNRYINILLVLVAFSIPLYRTWVVVATTLVTVLWFWRRRQYRF